MRIFTLILSLIVMILFIIFLILNRSQYVDIRFLGFSYSGLPLFLVVFLSFLAGVFFALVIAVVNEIRIRNQLGRIKKENRRLKEELISLRNLPVEEEAEEKE
ncbi:hypothetical protein DRP53_06820 [candidate division WOR-3 bacterium]|uniref:Lipopolysaccharide assembly protein A domain-containing protein n=1 Tax=candidate division WOR-3 bacterium TaxID=2052148 RepID=A0A660SIM2_UNCW3|nr:MAG: hypothetical protein DRP53_06820 [candidate division WOR-3 bacterium]